MYLPDNSFLQGGKYRIRRFISSGGFGCTYEAEHVMLEERVAIKEFFVKDFCNRDEVTSHVTVGTLSKKGLVEKMRHKFIDEAKALRKLHHPSIVSVSDVFEENGTAYFVMDYVEGRSLREIVDQEGPLTEERAVRYIRQVAKALQHVHDNNRLHLDIKPGNIMINLEDRPVLIDFGASKQYDEFDGENTSTLMGKTPGYAPPEQMSNSVVKFSPAIDIYSLGATLYKLLTGITPLDVNLRISGEELAPLPASISVTTRNTVSTAMEINKNKRPQSLAEFLSLLDTTLVSKGAKDETTIIEVKEKTEGATGTPNVEPMVPLTKPTERQTQKPEPSVKVLPPELQYEIDSEDCFCEMIFVSGGSFTMGASVSDTYAFNDERPAHQVELSNFYIGKYLITQAQWVKIMGTNPSRIKGTDLPVENISWNDVQEFLIKLNVSTGKKYRLPTEAEWEYAARGGCKSQRFKYSGSDDINKVAWYRGNAEGKTHPVGSKAPNELGIYDMTGNVYEWCQDFYSSRYYEGAPSQNPRGISSGLHHVLRGGSYHTDVDFCHISNRNYNRPGRRYSYYGIRLALDIK